jgi:hypothetical protein
LTRGNRSLRDRRQRRAARQGEQSAAQGGFGIGARNFDEGQGRSLGASIAS